MVTEVRVLLAVGCDHYDHNNALSGAELDATRIYNALIRPEVGEYDPSRSRLLLSPTYDEVRTAIRKTLFSGDKIDTFTFFFAGHGGVRSGSFYMLLRDSQSEALSASAFSLADFFLNINEASPLQSNIVIDACESGGLIEDLGVLLKSNLIGDSNTPGITLLAMAAKNQESSETDAGGTGTNAILDVIEGRMFVQDSASTLDLVEIGRAVSTRLRSETDQTPVVWGLNLYGPPRFCKNPRYGSDPAASLRGVIQGWPAGINVSVREHYEQLWSVYANASGAWDARAFSDAVAPVLDRLKEVPDALIGFANRLRAAVLERSTLSDDVFRPTVVSATIATCLLKYATDPIIGSALEGHQRSIADSLNKAATITLERLRADKYALLAPSGLADLYYLPERIAKVLGWTAAAGILDPRPAKRAVSDAIYADLLREILSTYSSSIVIMSDAQAPAWAVVLAQALALGLREEAEQIAGLLFNSILDCRGDVAVDDLAADKVFDFLMSRKAGDRQIDAMLLARPCLITTVLFLAADRMELADIFDQDLWRMDGESFTAYVNGNAYEWGAQYMEAGKNLTWTIGRDIFRVRDLHATWPTADTAMPKETVVAAGVVLASLLYPDRVAWHLFPMPRQEDGGPQ